jgi:hypothetical protein
MTGPEHSSARHVDLFISYAGPDRPWAQWASAQLEAAGYTVELDVWDWKTGANVILKIDEALAHADRVLALWSPAYFERPRFTTAEWTAVMAGGASAQGEYRLVPIRVSAVEPPPFLRSLLYRDVFGLDEEQARTELLAAITGPTGRGKPVRFPNTGTVIADGRARSRVPGTIPTVWNIPGQNRVFTGRQGMLAALHEHLSSGHRTLIQALNGIGGVGKTQLAIEYAHMFAGEYDLVWWIDAERPELIGEQFVRLAHANGWVSGDATVATAWQRVSDQLRRTDRWLLIFDNVEAPDHIHRWLPQGLGHVVITSRHKGFTSLATPVHVEVFTRAESIDLLHSYLPRLRDTDADVLAEALGDLPLAVAQAAGLLAETAMSVSEYLQNLEEQTCEILSEGRPFDYPVSLAATIQLSLKRLDGPDPAAVDLLYLASVLAPDPIPLDWIRNAPPGGLTEDLVTAAAKPLAFRQMLARIANLGLAQIETDAIQVHRVTQAVIRDQRPLAALAIDKRRATTLVAAAEPENDGTDPNSWPAWAALLPHLLALDPSSAPSVIRGTSCNALWYLLRRADYGTVLHLAQEWRTSWLQTQGQDDWFVLWASSHLSSAHEGIGQYEESYDLTRDIHERLTRTLGPDHPETLRSAGNLASSLSTLKRHREALDLEREIYDRSSLVFGPDHISTLTAAINLGADLKLLQCHQEALDLEEDTYERSSRIFGPDHPCTLTAASNLATSLSSLKRYQEACDLSRDIYDRRCRILGPDHPDTLISANNCAINLSSLRRHQEACDLSRDTYDRRCRILGPDHPDTLVSADALDAIRREMDRDRGIIGDIQMALLRLAFEGR